MQSFALVVGKAKKKKKKRRGADFFENKILLKYLVQFFFLNVTIRCCIRWQEAKICFRTHSPRTRAAVSCFGANYFKHRLFDTVSSFGPEKKKTVFISLSNTEFCVLLFLLPII